MASVMLALGAYRFSLATAPYQQLERVARWRWPSQDLLVDYPVRQFTGPGDVTHKLQGVVLPHYRNMLGGANLLSRMPELAQQLGGVGQALTVLQRANLSLTSGGGAPGKWILDALKNDADRGLPMLMVDGRGRDWGYWCVEQVGETETYHLSNGAALRVAFNIDLSYYGEATPRGIGGSSALVGAIIDMIGSLA